MQKQKPYQEPNPEKEQEYIQIYKQKIYHECDPFFKDGNILQIGEEKELNEVRKLYNSCEGINDVVIFALELKENFIATTTVVSNCACDICY